MATPEERQAYADAERERLRQQAQEIQEIDLKPFGVDIDSIAHEVLMDENQKLKLQAGELHRQLREARNAIEERDKVISRQQDELEVLRSKALKGRWEGGFDPLWGSDVEDQGSG